MQKVFLSHSSKDKAFVRRLADELQREEIEVWLDEFELRVGDDLSPNIIEGIRTSKFLVLVLSNAAIQSDWVEREIEIAEGFGNISILPVFLEDISSPLGPRLARRAIADFRVGTEYRNSLSRLLNAINHSSPFLTAKAAALKVKNETSAHGELFGLSQQGVATLYSLANRRDWVFADARDGVSRLWIVELYDRKAKTVHPFAVMRRQIHELPVLHLLDSDSEPVADSVIVMSCALNETNWFSGEVASSNLAQGDDWKRISKRYTRFRPAVLTRSFIDSDVAVRRALESPGARQVLGHTREIFTLAKIECDKALGSAVLWKISFFDPSLSESVLTVGLDAITGAVKYPAMRAELLNADFLKIREEQGKYVIDISNQLRAIENRVWDIAAPGEPYTARPTAADALHLASVVLGKEAHLWQFAFLSNTGVLHSVASQSATGNDRLMRVDGTAGQWVVEVCGMTPTPITEAGRFGYQYAYRQVLVTPESGAVVVGTADTCVFTVPLARCPIPSQLVAAFDAAMALALRTVTVEFEMFSVAHSRPPGGLEWCFRFYAKEEIVAIIWISGEGSRVVR